MKKHSLKKSLVASVIMLAICVTSLIGTTFAWFTDSVSSSNNIIKSGTLDIVLEYYDTKTGKWNDVKGSSDILSGDLWEPGYVDVAYLRVKNNGDLALKYALSVNIVSETTGISASGADVKLSDYIYFDVDSRNGKDNPYSDRDDAMKIATGKTTISEGYTKSGTLEAGSDYVYLSMVVYMPTWIGNEANCDVANPASIDLGINVFATQASVESDSFDDQYDKDTTVVFNVEDANILLAKNKDATLVNCTDTDGILYVPQSYTGTLTLENVKIASIQETAAASVAMLSAESGASAALNVVDIKILGNVSIVATKDGMSAITGRALNITGTGTLTAIAKGNFAYGIGGENTESISISGITIDYIAGGHVQKDFVIDLDYGKQEPTGGAAIGSGFRGAKINLSGVTINEAYGGSKAAGIGGRYWTGVEITIENSIINKIVGGNASAAIGGSRLSEDAGAEQNVSITIKDSHITAFGGQFAAGIGSGYDVHCAVSIAVLPDCNIVITGASVINATGGKYGAGIGTGYHAAGLSGTIDDSVVINAVGGGNREKYTIAMPVGFGVVDMAREGSKASASAITYGGNELTLENATTVVATQDALNKAVANAKDGTVIFLADGNYVMPTKTQKSITITGTKNAKLSLPFASVSASGNTITIKGVTVYGENNGSYYSYLFDGAKKVVFENCEIYEQLTTYCDVDFVNCKFYNTYENDYSVYCYSGKEIKFDGCFFDTKCSKAIKLYDDGNGGRNVYVNDCTFTTETANKKAAIEIDSTFSPFYLYLTGNNVIKGAYTKLWNSDPGEDINAHVYINGDDVINTIKIGTKEELFAFANDVNVNGNSYSGKTVVLTANIDLENTEWTPIGQTGGNGAATYFQGSFDGMGYTISNLKISQNDQYVGGNYATGLFGFVDGGVANIRNLTVDGADVTGTHWTAVIVGYLTGKVENCKVYNASVVCNHVNGEACGDKAGVIVGYVQNFNTSTEVSAIRNCYVENSSVKAGRDAGVIVGCANSSTVANITDNTFDEATVTVSATGNCTNGSAGKNIKLEYIGRIS